MSDSQYFERNEVWVGDVRARDHSDLPGGVVVKFHPRSQHNVVRLAPNNSWRRLEIDLSSAVKCTVKVGAIKVQFGGVRISFVANSGTYSTNVSVSVGDGCVFNGSTHIIGPLTPGLEVRVGKDCLFASGITIRGSSHHGLWDKESGALLNPEVGISIGDHVWIGQEVSVLNKAKIPDGSVVAAKSIVNKAFEETDVLLAGAPAAIRRRGIAWTSEFPSDNGAAPRRNARR
ncbi:LbetaH domain-containing protein [Puerhibacterium puerhi]|uniref:hypothetical protein n=1 Tax=Puerhibacterium puerhi TaxID=2692623 RepID=UPI001356E30E|nr:hypothetical protein [Puerhibacterium puerhi]